MTTDYTAHADLDHEDTDAAAALDMEAAAAAELDAAAEAGHRAATWLRALPGSADGWVGDLADAVEEAMSSLDPDDRDDVAAWGLGGVAEGLRERLDVTYTLAGADWLTAQQKAAVLAVTGCVLAIPKTLANDPQTTLDHDLAVLCDVLDAATRLDQCR
ncbi:hypothetical protein [Streptomyces sp. NPDC051909]|uniref:hypothetical protein n=1 Tax=Streptomyces sp. NPDC051909 TaxID=3154944 RepID=UPI003419BBDF